MPAPCKQLILNAILAASLCGGAQYAQAASATYQIRFEIDWSAATHPGAYPANAHFSTLIGATHQHQVSLWRPGQLASAGIQQMAETGGISLLTTQLQSMIASGQAGMMFTSPGPDAPGLGVIDLITVDESVPDVSLVTMIAPSPDWFVGVHNVPMIASGSWRQSVSIDLDSYDSGTDSGVTFVAPNLATTPHVPIGLVQEVPLNVAPVGRFVFTLLSSTGAPDRLFADGMEALVE